MTPSPPSSPPLKPFRLQFRLQFSLRMMLLLMAAIGLALMVYRWPWVETSQGPTTSTYWTVDPSTGRRSIQHELVGEIECRTTYRRNWRAWHVMDGPEQIWRDGRLSHEAIYSDGQLNGKRRAYNRAGQLTLEAMYRGDELHGSFRAGDGHTWVLQGNYRRGLPHGVWHGIIERQNWSEPRPLTFGFLQTNNPHADYSSIHIPDDPIVVVSNWDRGHRQGTWTCQTLNGEVLYTAEYDRNDLVRWNGEPVVEQFWQWLASPQVNDAKLVAQLTAASNNAWVESYQSFAFDHLTFQITSRGQQSSDLRIYLVGIGDSVRVFPYPDRSLVPALCEMAAVDGYGFDYRYGALWLVPRADPEPPFVDPTGVSQIEFSPGTQRERDWNAMIDVQSCEGLAADCAQHLLLGTSLGCNVESAMPIVLINTRSNPNSDLLFTRRRRDALGLVLYQTGCRCERRGNTLFIFPREERSAAQVNAKPLARPVNDAFR